MADEITYIVYLKVDKGGAKWERAPGTLTIDMTGTDITIAVQNIGTSAEAIAKGDITTPGMCLFHNLDGTNYVEIGYDDTGFKPTVRINAGEYALLRLTQATPQAKADTAAVNLEYMMIEA